VTGAALDRDLVAAVFVRRFASRGNHRARARAVPVAVVVARDAQDRRADPSTGIVALSTVDAGAEDSEAS